MSINELVADADTFRDRMHEVQEIYFPHDKTFFGKMRNFWDIYRPRNAIDAINLGMSPAAYYLAKLPPPIHKTLNDILKYSTQIITGINPEVGAATGITYGLSEILYGLKTQSGKRLLSGLVGSLTHMKKIPEFSEFARRAEEILDAHIPQFKAA